MVRLQIVSSISRYVLRLPYWNTKIQLKYIGIDDANKSNSLWKSKYV